MSFNRSQVFGAAVVVVSWITIGTFIFHALEKWTWIQAIYFSTVTLTTVGYGDLHPTTDFARLVTVFYILFGVAAVLSAVGVLGAARVDKRAHKIAERKRRQP